MNRRDFLFTGCAACLAAVATTSIFSSCTSTRYISGTIVKDGLTLSKDEFMLEQKGNIAYRLFVIVRNDTLKFPICVYRFSDQEYSAIWMRCSHQGAELQASGDVLQCPAHGSEFNNKGKVTNGPADRDLRTFPVTVNNNELFIERRKLA